MINKSKFTYQSRDGIHNIMAYKWHEDSVPVRGIIQIVHGMQEHMERYDEFASFLCSNGFIVVGNDHLGHGLSAGEGEYGYFCTKDARTVVTRDVHRLKKMITKEYPGLPCFLLGHSMGSFILRKYLTMYGTGIDGAIICGTGFKPAIVTSLGKFTATFTGLFSKGKNYSRFIEKTAFGSYNKRFKEENNPSSWVVRNEDVMSVYKNDPLCTFRFTTNGFHTLFSLLGHVDRQKNINTVPTELPVLFLAGSNDPVGNYGKGVTEVYNRFKKAGINDVSLKIYPDMRHEILNDIDRKMVYSDILDWINEHFPNC